VEGREPMVVDFFAPRIVTTKEWQEDPDILRKVRA
jgi:hypothetical protein